MPIPYWSTHTHTQQAKCRLTSYTFFCWYSQSELRTLCLWRRINDTHNIMPSTIYLGSVFVYVCHNRYVCITLYFLRAYYANAFSSFLNVWNWNSVRNFDCDGRRGIICLHYICVCVCARQCHCWRMSNILRNLWRERAYIYFVMHMLDGNQKNMFRS